ncbi:MAG: DUF4249 family protein [Cyclobacteriaceae bacterium]
MKGNHILTIFIVMMVACERPIDRPVQLGDRNTLIVEGIITNEKKSHFIKLSHPHAQNGGQVPVSGAILQIVEGSNIYLASESPAGSGTYVTQVMQATFGKTYLLRIQYQGKEYTAQDSSVPVEPFVALSYRKANDLYTLNSIQSGSGPNFIDHSIIWKNTNFCTSGNTCEGRIIFYDLKTADVNELFKPSKKEFVFPLGSTVIRKKYSCSPAFQNFLRSVLSETEWRGGVFDVQRANATTNLSNGAIGFFAVSTVLSDTTVINP